MENNGTAPFLAGIFVANIVWIISSLLTATEPPILYEVAMEEAFERGYAVECLGKEGYFWECEENNNGELPNHTFSNGDFC